MVLAFCSPADLILFAGPEEGEEPSGASVIRPIQIRLTTPFSADFVRVSSSQARGLIFV